MNNKTSLVVNIILAIAVAALFVLHFTAPKASSTEQTVSDTASVAGATTIAWVNMDTILNNYEMYFDMKAELEKNGRKLEAQLNAKTKAFENDAKDFQNKVQKGLVTRSEAQQLQTNLANKEQELYMLRDQMRMQLAEEEQVKLRQIHNSIVEYLKDYNADKGYQMIFSSTFGGQVLYGHPSIDITQEVLKGLNEKYLAGKQK